KPTSIKAGSVTISLPNPATAVTVTNGAIHFGSAHNFNTGQQVTYSNGGGTSVGGLTSGSNYFVIVVDSTTVKLASSQANAVAGTAISLTSVGSGTGHSLTPLPTGSARSFDAGAAAVTVSTTLSDTITFASNHNLTTGDIVIYKNGGGTSIGGLTDGNTYYVIKVDNTHIRFAATLNDANAATPKAVYLTSVGSGTSHNLILQPASANAGGLTIPLPAAIGTQLVSVTAAGAGGKDGQGAGAISLNFVRMSVDSHISNALGIKRIQAGRAISVLAEDSS